ncbi:hypothetical protein E2C01_046613 [Portunus trituberculatus]|uniref:Uncharacterized protein n=1 Tax=Portunus trituberculatus TaxID=210409 RepID=A0A5B7G5A1_PORTR|nr:hypothetical protein [Portunus trituberculatus]
MSINVCYLQAVATLRKDKKKKDLFTVSSFSSLVGTLNPLRERLSCKEHDARLRAQIIGQTRQGALAAQSSFEKFHFLPMTSTSPFRTSHDFVEETLLVDGPSQVWEAEELRYCFLSFPVLILCGFLCMLVGHARMLSR